jgi:glucose-1-phosphate adenylyltransferase
MHSSYSGLLNTVAFVMAGGAGERLRPLTDCAPKPLLPFGGVFRILDFTLSNCRNSGVPMVGVLTQYLSHQIGHHLRRVWEPAPVLTSFVHLPPPSGVRYRGTADAVRQNLRLAAERGARYALILSADHVYQADYRDLVRFHRNSGADVTVSAVRVPLADAGNFGILRVDETGVITRFEEKPARPQPLPDDPNAALASMGVYVFSMDALVDALFSGGGLPMDFGHDVLPVLLRRRRVVAWEFRSAGGRGSYWRDVGTFDGYQAAHMDFLDGEAASVLASSRWPIAAADGAIPGVIESPGRIGSLLRRSLAPAEARIEGDFERSVLSPGVWIGKRADVQRSVLMHGVRVGPGARIRCAIVGSGVHIPAGERIGYDLQADRSRFHVTDSGLVVIDSQARFAPRWTERTIAPVRLKPSHISLVG